MGLTRADGTSLLKARDGQPGFPPTNIPLVSRWARSTSLAPWVCPHRAGPARSVATRTFERVAGARHVLARPSPSGKILDNTGQRACPFRRPTATGVFPAVVGDAVSYILQGRPDPAAPRANIGGLAGRQAAGKGPVPPTWRGGGGHPVRRLRRPTRPAWVGYNLGVQTPFSPNRQDDDRLQPPATGRKGGGQLCPGEMFRRETRPGRPGTWTFDHGRPRQGHLLRAGSRRTVRTGARATARWSSSRRSRRRGPRPRRRRGGNGGGGGKRRRRRQTAEGGGNGREAGGPPVRYG